MLNFILATINDKGKDILYATKFAKGLKPPSLFYLKYKNEYVTISSEKLNDKVWVNVKNNSLIKVHDNKITIKDI